MLLVGEISYAQVDVRKQIDSERSGSFADDNTLEKARSFIRRDSTYYVGYMFEGAYLFFRANDALGFTKAIAPLKKALELIELDFDTELRTRTNNYFLYNGVYRYHRDYGLIAYALSRCYQNIEKQNEAMEVLYHVRDYNFQVEQGISSYNTMAWIVQRSRMYTSRQFHFLKNTVKENVALADHFLDSAKWKIRRDNPVNMGLFDPVFLNRQLLDTYHYKAIINDYKLDIDSASYYYSTLIMNEAYSPNNYAEFKLAMGEFDEADHFFREAASNESPEKTTKEYFYMLGSLETYRGHPEKADTLLTKVLKQQGSTPGFGWHCIGLARAQHFEGLTAESQDRANRAARFQELHIGTTWGQEQYNLAVASLNYINQLQFKKEYFFERDEWWFWLNPVNWYKWLSFTLEIRHHKMVLASLVAENPEREQVIYTIFSSENLMSFDEVWSVIDGFGNEYFIDIYKKLLETDKRPRLKKYFRYFLGKLHLAEGKNSEAIEYFQQVLNDADIYDPHETMLRARTYEGLAMATSGDVRSNWINIFYQTYPQLVPFSGIRMKFDLNVESESEDINDIVRDLKNCSISFSSGEYPHVNLQFSKSNTGIIIQYTVVSTDKTRILQHGTLEVENSEMNDAGRVIAYRLFGINKARTGEQVEIAKEPTVSPI